MKNPERTISDLLSTSFIARKLVYYSSLSSTMDVAKEMAQNEAPEGTTVIAGRQTAGRGRLGRSWLSPEGSLAMSVILRPKIQHLPQLVMASSLAVVRTVKENCGLEARIKWPNDVLLNGRKVCGILTESELKGGQVKFAIIGIGLNINMDPLAFPEIAAIATSLSAETGGPVSFEKVTAGLLNNLEHYYLRLRSGEPLIAEWRQNMETIGRKVRVRNNDEVTEGTAEDVTADGALLIRCNDGSLVTVLAGDVTMVRD